MDVLNRDCRKNIAFFLNDDFTEPLYIEDINSDVNIFFKLVYNFTDIVSYDAANNQLKNVINVLIDNIYHEDEKYFSTLIEWDYYEPQVHNKFLDGVFIKRIDDSAIRYVKGFTIKANPFSSKINISNFLYKTYSFFIDFLNDLTVFNPPIKNHTLFIGIIAKEILNKTIFDKLSIKLLNNINLKKTPRNMTVLSVPIKNITMITDLIESLRGL